MYKARDFESKIASFYGHHLTISPKSQVNVMKYVKLSIHSFQIHAVTWLVCVPGMRDWSYDESEFVMMGNDIDLTVQPQGFQTTFI